MTQFASRLTRKEALTSLLVLPALAGVLAGPAQATDMRTQLKYQATPKGKQKCLGCTLYVAGKTPKADGTCKVIPGPISPNGWCTAFAPKA